MAVIENDTVQSKPIVSFEKQRSLEQKLTFESARAEFSRRKDVFGISLMAELGLLDADRVFTNLALLMSDQCYHTIKVAVFRDPTQMLIEGRHEFSSSVFKQIEGVFGYFDLGVDKDLTFEGLPRIDFSHYPPAALREALINAVIHREYAITGSILIKIFSDRIEFISPGGAVGGIEAVDIKSGYAACRNPDLASVFYRLQLVESHGTGVLKIYDAYKTSLAQPKIEITPNVFKLTLPSMNAAPLSNTKLTPEENVIRFVLEHGSINRKQAEHILGVSQTAAGIVLRSMVERGDLSRQGHSRNIRYFAAE